MCARSDGAGRQLEGQHGRQKMGETATPRRWLAVHGVGGGQDCTMKRLVVGHVTPGRLVNQLLQHEPPTPPWSDTLALGRDRAMAMI